MVFPVVMHGCESWTIKKAECRWIDAFERWWWRRLLRVPWTAKRSNQSIQKEINPEYLSEGLMLKLPYLATWCKQPTLWKRCWSWERLKAGGGGDNRGWDGWMMWLTKWTWVWANSGSLWRTEEPDILQPMALQSQTQLSDWTTTVMCVPQNPLVEIQFPNAMVSV